MMTACLYQFSFTSNGFDQFTRISTDVMLSICEFSAFECAAVPLIWMCGCISWYQNPHYVLCPPSTRFVEQS